ncbi:MAG: class I SAM-dependent methyltransferase, partial [Planctomycetota bacterium]
TADIREFDTDKKFDRVISIEMFEHMRNYQTLLGNISRWMHDHGKLLVHVFCHRDLAYTFETDGNNDWMARHFFTGGLMPSADLFANFQDDLRLETQWDVNGEHYAKTCEAWLAQQDAQSDDIVRLFAKDLGEREARIQSQRWRMFHMACAELFRYDGGQEWFVSHYRFSKQEK